MREARVANYQAGMDYMRMCGKVPIMNTCFNVDVLNKHSDPIFDDRGHSSSSLVLVEKHLKSYCYYDACFSEYSIPSLFTP